MPEKNNLMAMYQGMPPGMANAKLSLIEPDIFDVSELMSCRELIVMEVKRRL